jgi:hypothetical protein
VPESLIPRTLQALVTLDLIDENGAPTPVFESLRLAPEPEFKSKMQEWLKATYADAFEYVDPSKDDETRIRDAFRRYNPVGQQDRMVTLFQGLCAAAGLRPEKASSPRPSPSRPRPSLPLKPAPKTTQKAAGRSSHPRHPTGLPSALMGLLEDLPNGEGWTAAERDRFMTTFEALLAFYYPVIERREMADEE